MSEILIVNAEPEDYSPQALEILQSVGRVVEGPFSREQLKEQLPEADVLIVRLGIRVDQQILDWGQKLRAVVTATTGLDHIDLEYTKQKRVEVLSLKGEEEFLRSIPATAELTWALLLALMRNLPGAINSVLEGDWTRNPFRGYDLNGKILGILGLGRIGEIVARYGITFGMRVVAYDPFRKGWGTDVEREDSLEHFLGQLDVLSIHVPLNDHNVGFIGEDELACLQNHAVLINTSRGGILNEAALIDALENGNLSGAALDVLAAEHSKNLNTSPLFLYNQKNPNLLITPHIGGASFDSMFATEIFMANKLKKFIEALT